MSTEDVQKAALSATHDQARDELRRADSKAQTLLSVVGLAFAGVTALAAKSMSVPATVALYAAAVPILVSVLLLLSAIRPRLGTGDPVAGTWLYAAKYGPASLLESVAAPTPITLATDVHALATIAQAKYHRVRRAVTLLVIGLGFLAVALVLGQVAR